MRIYSFSGQPLPVLSELHSKEVLPVAEVEYLVLLFVPMASCPATGHHGQEPGSILFELSLYIFKDIDKILLSLLFFQAELSHLFLLTEEVSQSLDHVCDVMLDSVHYAEISLVQDGPEPDTALQVSSQQCWVKEEGSSLLACHWYFSQCRQEYQQHSQQKRHTAESWLPFQCEEKKCNCLFPPGEF